MLKKVMQITAMILVLAMCVQLAPLDALATSRVDDPVKSQYEPEVYDVFAGEGVLEANDNTILCEDEEKREEAIKHFRLSDGSMVAAVYDVPVHEKDSTGAWVDIDNTLSIVNDSKGNSKRIKIGASSSVEFDMNASGEKLLTITTDDGKISWSFDGASSKAASTYTEPTVEANNSKMSVKSVSGVVTYKDIQPGISLDYQLIGNDVKAIPHNSGRGITLSDFSSDETKSGANTLCISEHFCKI